MVTSPCTSCKTTCPYPHPQFVSRGRGGSTIGEGDEVLQKALRYFSSAIIRALIIIMITITIMITILSAIIIIILIVMILFSLNRNPTATRY